MIAEDIDVFFDEPTLDRWVYPFNADPGFRTTAPVFGALTSMGFDPAFDNRDGQMLIGFDTAGVVRVGLGPQSYHVARAMISVTVSSDQTFAYDPTPDPVGSWLPPGDPNLVADRDPGRPVELFGAGFRYGWTALTFAENGPFCDGCSCFPPNPCVSVRSVFPIDLTGACLERDVSNNVLELFDPVPFAVGANDGGDTCFGGCYANDALLPLNGANESGMDLCWPPSNTPATSKAGVSPASASTPRAAAACRWKRDSAWRSSITSA